MSEAESVKGELYELRAELHSDKRDRRKDAVKKVIAIMTVGKDVSQLFPDVISCMQTDNLELKKLVYLYLINYAKGQPDMAVLAVATLLRDCSDPSPLIRALAIRTMACIRVEKITEYLCEPLRKCLKDEDPYVRKTAAICVAKMYDMSPRMVDDQGFLDLLRDLVSDPNGMVVANAVAALSEISEKSSELKIFDLNPILVNKLLTALNECAEWGQIFILDALANYVTENEREAQMICERIKARLAHANSAVVLSSVKVLLAMTNQISPTNEFVSSVYRKMAPPLVTLLAMPPETQYVALRNINLILQKKPELLKNDLKVFFVKYNDPVYVKIEKLDIMIRLTDASNIAPVLAELKEYSAEVDVDFVRKSVRAIGRCAIKVEQAAERCVTTLIDLIETKVNYVVQEAIIVIRDIFRKYPNKYENIIGTLCDNLETLDEPDARAAMIWIIGEYAERIDNTEELLESFLENFKDETNQVQYQLLTAIVKLFLKKPTNSAQELVTRVLKLVTQEIDNPDLRDRGYIYWRLLSTDPRAAKEVVLAEKALISEETDLLETAVLDELLREVGSLASVYHRPAHSFVEGRFLIGRSVSQPIQIDSMRLNAQPEAIVINNDENLLGDDFNMISAAPVSQGPSLIANLLDEDLSSILDLDSNVPSSTTTNTNLLESIFSSFSMNNNQINPFEVPMSLPKEIWLTAQKGKGLEISGTFFRRNGEIIMDMDFNNKALQPMHDFALQINRNSFALMPSQPLTIKNSILPSQSFSTELILNTNGTVLKMDPLGTLQVAVKNNIDIHYFTCLAPIHIFFIEQTQIDKLAFIQYWQAISDVNEVKTQLNNTKNESVDQIQKKLTLNNVHTIDRRTIEQNEMLFQTIRLTNGILILAELTFPPLNSRISLSVKSQIPDVTQLIAQSYQSIINHS